MIVTFVWVKPGLANHTCLLQSPTLYMVSHMKQIDVFLQCVKGDNDKDKPVKTVASAGI